METRASPLQFFTDAFHALTGNVPLKWQERLFQERFLNDAIPTMLDLPTGLGKTSVMAIWYPALKAGARLPRRPCRDLITFVTDRPAHDWRYAVDASATNAALGWRPRTGLAEGLEATVRWYLANEAWWRPILAGRYGGERLGLAGASPASAD